MCGIGGILTFEPVDRKKLLMGIELLNHRGPDGTGSWFSDEGNVGLLHKRLSIIDLSNQAGQPMFSKDKRFVMIFNGEIYNYLEIKKTLEEQGVKFLTSSDSEVLLELFILKGEKCLQELDGMFAFAIWDKREKKLFCARDRFGEKPFYYHYIPGKIFVFASEIKFLWANGAGKEMDKGFVFRFLTQNSIAHPTDNSLTFYKDVKKLPPSSFMFLKENLGQFTVEKFWNLDLTREKKKISLEEAKIEFKALFASSVNRRLRSDVPVGTSLSGGLDSSAIVTVINQLSSGKNNIQKTFSARFKDFKRDEGYFMNLVSERTGVQPHFVWPVAEDFIRDFSTLLYHHEEPFQSASIYAQWCVMKLAKETGVTVLLDGQGADEMLGGYKKYRYTYMNELFRRNPVLYEREAEAILKTHDSNFKSYINSSGGFIGKIKKSAAFHTMKRGLKKMAPSEKKPEKSIVIPGFLHPDFVNSMGNPEKLFTDEPEYATLNDQLYHDTMISGLNTLLNYCDKNSMAHSVEVRLPFLNHHLAEFIFSLPSHLKINDGWSKFIQRVAFEDMLPTEISWRKEKIGYEAPQNSWLENETIKNMLNESVSLLSSEKIIRTGTNEMPKDWNLLMLAGCMSPGKLV
ncbi:MAG: asparagine synthase (glutamine-hydrolyzing) [Bacteroidia bacterium]|nr:asparagine synthase (glutamine-hydrolyzing) [Bacteroidia bacterium]